MRTLVRQRAVPAAVLAALTLGAPAIADADEVVFDADIMQFREVGPIEAIPGDVVRVRVDDDDPRRRWALALEYAEPVADRVKLDAAVVANLLAGARSRPGGGAVPALPADAEPIELADALRENAKGVAADARKFLAAPSVTLADAKALGASADAIARQRDEVVSKGRPANPDLREKYDAAIDYADEVVLVARAIARWCERAHAEHDLPFTVHDGFRRATIRVCYQQLGLEGTTLTPSEPICSRSYYDLPVRERPYGPRLAAGVLVPGYIDKPKQFFLEGEALTFKRTDATMADPEPALFVGARRPFGRSRAGWGPELGFALGSRLGELFTAGVFFDYWGASLGVGLGLDTDGEREAIPGVTTGTVDERTRPISLVTWYVRLGLSSELWESFSRAVGSGGPVNAEQPPPAPTTPSAPPAGETPREGGNGNGTNGGAAVAPATPPAAPGAPGATEGWSGGADGQGAPPAPVADPAAKPAPRAKPAAKPAPPASKPPDKPRPDPQ